MSVAALWEGKLIDATGPTALVELELGGEGRRLRGEFRATFLPPPDVDCGPSAPRTVASGEVSGTEYKAGGIRVTARLETAGVGVVVELRADEADADPHAKRALYGSYAVLEGADVLTMQGGACVLWQYAGARRRRAG